MTETVYALARASADKLAELLDDAGEGVPGPRGRPAAPPVWCLVVCNSEEPAAGDAAGAIMYDAARLELAAGRMPAAAAAVWLTLCGPGGRAMRPTLGAVYEAVLAGSAAPEGGPARRHAFAAARLGDNLRPLTVDANCDADGKLTVTVTP